MPEEPNDSAFGFSRASLISSATELAFTFGLITSR